MTSQQPCPEHSQCFNSDGSFVCYCEEGYYKARNDCRGKCSLHLLRARARACVCVCVCVYVCVCVCEVVVCLFFFKSIAF